jgi:hypothetical protein
MIKRYEIFQVAQCLEPYRKPVEKKFYHALVGHVLSFTNMDFSLAEAEDIVSKLKPEMDLGDIEQLICDVIELSVKIGDRLPDDLP